LAPIPSPSRIRLLKPADLHERLGELRDDLYKISICRAVAADVDRKMFRSRPREGGGGAAIAKHIPAVWRRSTRIGAAPSGPAGRSSRQIVNITLGSRRIAYIAEGRRRAPAAHGESHRGKNRTAKSWPDSRSAAGKGMRTAVDENSGRRGRSDREGSPG